MSRTIRRKNEKWEVRQHEHHIRSWYLNEDRFYSSWWYCRKYDSYDAYCEEEEKNLAEYKVMYYTDSYRNYCGGGCIARVLSNRITRHRHKREVKEAVRKGLEEDLLLSHRKKDTFFYDWW